MPYPLARREAIESILGDVSTYEDAPMPTLNPHIVPTNTPSGSPSKKNRHSMRDKGHTTGHSIFPEAKSYLKHAPKVAPPPPEALNSKVSGLLNLKFPLTETIMKLQKTVGK